MLVCKVCIYLEEEELTDNDTSRAYATKTYRGKDRRGVTCSARPLHQEVSAIQMFTEYEG